MENKKTKYKAKICSEIIRLHIEREERVPDFSKNEKWSFSPITMAGLVRFTDETEKDIRYIKEYQVSLEGELMLLDEKNQTLNWAACDNTLLDIMLTTLAKISENKRKTTKTYTSLLSELKEWTPENRFVTSNKEIQMLSAHFRMDEMSITDLKNLRDMAVLFYTREGKVQMQPMMSLTTVIDIHIAKKGRNL